MKNLNGKSIVRGNYARFYDAFQPPTAWFVNPLANAEVLARHSPSFYSFFLLRRKKDRVPRRTAIRSGRTANEFRLSGSANSDPSFRESGY